MTRPRRGVKYVRVARKLFVCRVAINSGIRLCFSSIGPFSCCAGQKFFPFKCPFSLEWKALSEDDSGNKAKQKRSPSLPPPAYGYTRFSLPVNRSKESGGGGEGPPCDL